jgi:hypothetical protein
LSKPLPRYDLLRLDPRNVRRQRLALHLHEAGPRPVLEALLDVANGRDLDVTLEDFARVSASTFHEVGARDLPIQRVSVLKGGKS